jgi:DNA-binding NarL/FixJ family response regulator
MTRAIVLKDEIRRIVFLQPDLPPVEIAARIFQNHGQAVSPRTVSLMRSEFKEALAFLQREGVLQTDTSFSTRERVTELLGQGLKPAEVARRLGVTKARVSQIKASVKNTYSS